MTNTQKTGLITTTLDELARDYVGDGKPLNHFFVSDNGHVVTVTDDFEIAYRHWKQLSARRPMVESTLEDRLTGTIASVEPVNESPNAPLAVYDDSRLLRTAGDDDGRRS